VVRATVATPTQHNNKTQHNFSANHNQQHRTSMKFVFDRNKGGNPRELPQTGAPVILSSSQSSSHPSLGERTTTTTLMNYLSFVIVNLKYIKHVRTIDRGDYDDDEERAVEHYP